MRRLHINKSFEEELAEKANEFRMQPSTSLWDNIESGLDTSASYAKAKLLASATSAVIIALSLFIFTNIGTAPDTEIISQEVFAENIDPENSQKYSSRLYISEDALLLDHNLGEKYYNNLIIPFVNPTRETEASENTFSSTEQNTSETPQLFVAIEAAPEAAKRKPRVMRPIKPMPQKDALYVSLSVTPSYSFRTLERKQEFASEAANQRNTTDRAAIGLSARFMAKYYLNEGFAISSGIGINRWGEYIGLDKSTETSHYTSLASELGYSPNDLYTAGNSIRHLNTYEQIEIPMLFHFEKYSMSRLSLGATVGMSFAHTSSKNFKAFDFQVQHYVHNPDILRAFNINVVGGISATYKLSNRAALMVGPEARYSLFSMYYNFYPITQKQYSVGLNVGFQFKLSKIKEGLDK